MSQNQNEQEPETEDRRYKIMQALQDVMHSVAEHDSEKGIVVHFTLSMEVVGQSGEVWLKHFASPDLSGWLEIGMLTTALDDVRARMVNTPIYSDLGDDPELG